MGRTLAEQSIEQSIVEESAERARNGGSRTLAQHSLDQEAREILQRRADREAERDADEAADNGRNTGGKSYYRPPTE